MFNRVSIMQKGTLPKLKESIWNVPVHADDVSNGLPRDGDSNCLIVIKLKRKLICKDHAFFELVSSNLLNQTLTYLKENNPLYSDVNFDNGYIPNNLLSFADDNNPGPNETAEDSEEIENSLDIRRFNYQETLLVSRLSTGGKISVASGDEKQPAPVFSDVFVNNLPFPAYFH